MDYHQHEKMYDNFARILKYSISSIAILVIGLYCIIEAEQPLLGTIFVLLSVFGPVAMAIYSSVNKPVR
ncbi:aa3-type cytochrome c oxidase subunit IV [Devosia sp.]